MFKNKHELQILVLLSGGVGGNVQCENCEFQFSGNLQRTAAQSTESLSELKR